MIYAPALASGAEIRAVADATSVPQNVLAFPGLTMPEIVEAGGQRVSVGSQLAWAAVGAMARAIDDIRTTGSFESFAERVPIKDWLSR